MSEKGRISADVQDVWVKLNARWRGEDADAFHREYIVKISEIVDSFDDACFELSSLSAECMKELNTLEQTLMDQ
jgi:hypothetical protein